MGMLVLGESVRVVIELFGVVDGGVCVVMVV